ncbi:unnamed protein product [Amoebophrya sp. A120]|nr:unnamed protein product [Amoebophrya sp. A120]|eukprot:GSA120T00021709001.1
MFPGKCIAHVFHLLLFLTVTKMPELVQSAFCCVNNPAGVSSPKETFLSRKPSIFHDDDAAIQSIIYDKPPGATFTPASDIFKIHWSGVTVGEAKQRIRNQPGHVLVKATHISILPLARAHLDFSRTGGIDTGAKDLGLPATAIGDEAAGECVTRVIASNAEGYEVEDLLYIPGAVFDYRVVRADGQNLQSKRPPTKLPPGVDPTVYLAAFTVPGGVTAYLASEHSNVAKVLAAEQQARAASAETRGVPAPTDSDSPPVVLVSSAAGAVGLSIGQLYKMKGYFVIGSTSTRAKAERLTTEFGFDAAVAYQERDVGSEGSFEEGLRAAASEANGNHNGLIDFFVDNVGGEQLDTALRLMKPQGKVLTIGAISEMERYSTGNVRGCKEYLRIPARELLWGGFMVSAHLQLVPEAISKLTQYVAEGKLKTAATVKRGTLETWFSADDEMHKSQGFGRTILELM